MVVCLYLCNLWIVVVVFYGCEIVELECVVVDVD